jgi:uncharacterized protein
MAVEVRMSDHFIGRLLDIDRSTLSSDGKPDFNRLVFTSSPYLLQHATNPIDWYPWQSAAFERARIEDKPVLVSIGYSTCHWCHVMAHESFEDPDVAELVNRHFVAIKIDREERPDLDATYMEVCQLMTGQGGWPLTLLVTPDRQPFFAATYLPKRSSNGMVGVIELLTKVHELWQTERTKLLQTCHQVVNALQQVQQNRTVPQPPDEMLLQEALDQFKEQFDVHHAGFGHAPKFPTPHNLSLLARLARRFQDQGAANMASRTLTALRHGGIYDQIGFGLHRYSVDAHWLVPHFEKMLYDQALYILACLDTWQQTGADTHFTSARQTASYVLRDLQHPDGGFYAGEDADSEGAEGSFYLWTESQLREVLPTGAADRFIEQFQVTKTGNFAGKSILHLAPGAKLPDDYDPHLQQLRTLREERARPHRDEKILTGWNGLMIAALARLSAGQDSSEFLDAAHRAYRFISTYLIDESGRLLRRYFNGEAGISAFLEDYAALAWGCLELYQAGFATADLNAAVHWTEQLLVLFDDGAGGFYDTAADTEIVLTRNRSLQDGALPTGISMTAGVLLRLGRLTGRTDLEERGRKLLEQHVGLYRRYPSAYAQALLAIDDQLGPSIEATIICGNNRAEATQMLQVLRGQGLPGVLIIWKERPDPELDRLAPRQQDQLALDGLSTVYLCSGRRCLEPTTTTVQLTIQLNSLSKRGTGQPDRYSPAIPAAP